MVDAPQHEIVLTGIDASNPLAFLAALGTLRGLTLARRDIPTLMGWRLHEGAWRPVLRSESIDAQSIADILIECCRGASGHPTLNYRNNIAVPRNEWREHVLNLVRHSDPNEATSFAAAFASDAIFDDSGMVADTALRTMSGAGHQHFVKTMRELLCSVNESHIHRTLFATWDYDDPLQGLSLRLDPRDDKRYGMQWNDPSGDPTRNKRGSMHGANALAVLGIPMLKVAPVRGKLHTTGFRGQTSRDCSWTWPVWTSFINCDVVSSLLSLEILQSVVANDMHEELRERAVAAVYRSQRITTGKFRNFTFAQLV